MEPDASPQATAPVTADDIVEFVRDLVAPCREGYRLTAVSYPTATARNLGRAKWCLETYCAWKPDSSREKDLAPVIEILALIMQSAFVDKEGDRVWFAFEPGDIEVIAAAVPSLDDYAMTKARDAKPSRRGGRR